MNVPETQKKAEDAQQDDTRRGAARDLLVRKAMLGSRDALQSLCKAIAQEVIFSTSRILRNRSDAEDAAQEVLIRVCTNIQDLNEPAAFNAWLGRIITNESRRIMMKNTKQNNVVDISTYLDSLEEDKEDFLPQEYTMRKEDRSLVMEIIEQLPERQREAIILHYYNCLSVTETAEAMSVRHQVVSRYLKLAREKIKEELGKQEDGSWFTARGLALMPIGSLIAQSLQQEAGLFTISKNALVERAMSSIPAIAKGGAKSALNGAGLAKAGAALLAAVAISAGLWFGVWMMNNKEPPPAPEPPPTPIIVVTSEYDVVFSGGDANAEQINPKQAVARVDTDHGEMTARGWWITKTGFDVVIYSGEGGVVEGELARMIARGEYGEYTLSFRMEDAAGATYTLAREFAIKE